MNENKYELGIYCLSCAFRNNLENNPDVMVKSKESENKISVCFDCDKRVGHSKSLNSLVGVYHITRHEANGLLHRSLRNGENLSLEYVFNQLRKSRLNGDTLNCFLEAVSWRSYSDRYIRKWFHKLVNQDDYEPAYENKYGKVLRMELYDKKILLEGLVEISNSQRTSKNPFFNPHFAYIFFNSMCKKWG